MDTQIDFIQVASVPPKNLSSKRYFGGLLSVDKIYWALALSVVLLLPASSHATPSTSTLAINGDSQLGLTFVNFLCDIQVPGSTPCPAGTGNFLTTGAGALGGSFVPYANDPGFIKNINYGAQPLNASFSLLNFVTFSPTGTVLPPDIALDLTFIVLGTAGQSGCGAPANSSQVCTPQSPALVTANNPNGLSPFNLANTAAGSTASITVAGNARRISTGEVTPFNGTFSWTFTSDPGTTDGSYQALLAQFSTGGTVTTPYSATFKANLADPAPEPGTFYLMLSGLLVVVGRARTRLFSRQ
jgi:hypothetical protein